MRRPTVLAPHVRGAGLLGLVVAAMLASAGPPTLLVPAVPVPVLVVLLLLVVGELLPIPVTRGDATTSSVSMSTTFTVALVVVGPVAPVLLVHLAGVLVGVLRGRRPAEVVPGLVRYAVSVLAGRACFAWLTGAALGGGYRPFVADQLAAALLAGMVVAATQHLLTGLVVSLRTGRPLGRTLAEDLRWTLETSAVLVGMAPVTALVMDRAPWMLLLLMLPMVAVRRSAQLAAASEAQALRDPLTGLGNRTSLQLRLDGRGTGSRRARVGVLLVDLDHFKDVNDTLGHDVGDRLLVEVAARLRAVAPPQAHVARLGGDEFAVLLRVEADDHASAAGQVAAVAHRVLDALRGPVDLGGTRLRVHASVGVAVVEPGRTAELLKRADLALYEAKEERGRVAVHAAGTDHGDVERTTVLAGLAEAVRAGGLSVAYQPQVDAVTGRTRSFEALLRWEDPRFAHVPPATLVRLAENAGFVDALSDLVLCRALGDLAGWRAAGHDVDVAVNLSARQLSDEALPGRIGRALAAHGVPAACLVVEVTESGLMVDARRADLVLASLRALGVRLSVDDFGTGYTSLLRLQQLDVDQLKIDGALVADLDGGAGGVLLRAILDLAATLGLEVVAEGVETAAVAASLAALGCDRLQGYHLARPVPAGEALRMLQDASGGTHRPARGVVADLPAQPGQSPARSSSPGVAPAPRAAVTNLAGSARAATSSPVPTPDLLSA